MWSSSAKIARRAFATRLLAAIALMAAGCTGSSDYITRTPEIAAIAVSVGGDRIGQLYRQRLERLFVRHGQSDTRYRLTANLTATEGEDFVTMSGSLALYDEVIGKIIATKNLTASVSIGATASLFGEEEAKRFARERLATHIAEKTYRYLLLYFARGTP